MRIRGQLLGIALAAVLPLPFVVLFFARESPGPIVLGGLLVGVFASAAAIFNARKLALRIERLEHELRRIGEGDFSARVPDPGSGGDEIAALENAFNAAIDNVAERRDRFVELDTLKSEFVSSVSHELRTPLTTIKALTRLLLRDGLPEAKRQEYLGTISVECDRQIDLVLNLLDLSRIEGGVFRVAIERVDVGEVVASCVKAETRAAERRNHGLTIEPFAEVPPAAADPKALRRVVSNLIENAIKYTPDGGSISVFAGAETDLVFIGVRDNGRGIPAEDMPILFDKFHRGRPAPHSAAMRNATEDAEFLEDADVSGLGLGLYLAKNVVERMGGDIKVDSVLGRGSTFTVFLPVWDRRLEDDYGEKTIGR